MKKLVKMVLVVVLFAQGAWAGDSFQVIEQDGSPAVMLNGDAQSASGEVYTILDKAGFDVTQYVEGKELRGDLLKASSLFLNGVRYNAIFTISNGSHFEIETPKCMAHTKCMGGKPTLMISGQVARELYGAMEKAGLPESSAMDIVSVRGNAVSCEMGSIPDAYACFITLQ